MRPDATLVHAAAWGLAAGACIAAITWAMSLPKRDVSIVDSAWSLLVWAPVAVVAAMLPQTGPRDAAVLALAAAWGLRLSAYITLRNRGQPEDRRYRAIRRRNDPHFEWKSLYLVFGLQAVLGWIVALPLMAAVASPVPWRALDAIGIALFAFGVAFEAVADTQLARFKSDSARSGSVLDTGLWRYSRHPNYFGECCVWWGAWLIAAAADAWWTVASPVLMTVLLLRVSGVKLLEADIGERRPAYADYVRRTNAFLPGRPRA